MPEGILTDITMDFITGLPNSMGNEVIFVMVDRLTKYSHFMALSHPYSAATVAQTFIDNIYRLHGLPSTIMNDRDPVFVSMCLEGVVQEAGCLHLHFISVAPSDGWTDGGGEPLS